MSVCSNSSCLFQVGCSRTTSASTMARARFLGHMDHDTREWFDDVLTASARRVIKEPVDTHNWIICDGDIDPESVELAPM